VPAPDQEHGDHGEGGRHASSHRDMMAAMRPIRAVLLDYSGVFTTPPFTAFPALEVAKGLPAGALLELLWGNYGDPAGTHAWHKLERGEVTFAEYWEDMNGRAKVTFGDDFDVNEMAAAMRENFAVHHVMVTRVRELKPSYRTALLTNNVKEFGEGWRSTIPVDELFDVVIDSSHVGNRKPEPAYFAHALDAVAVEADEAVFLDDMLCNVEGARDVGLTAIHVTDVGLAIDELDRLLAARSSA
jgi:epoxide hydrolase-like predicted phosphatase